MSFPQIAGAPHLPAHVHCGTTAIWHLADILGRLKARGTYELKAELFEIAAIAMQVNLARAALRAIPGAQREVGELVI